MAIIEERLQEAPFRLVLLAACGFARTVEHLLRDDRSRDALEVAERFADGLEAWIQAHHAWENALRVTDELVEQCCRGAADAGAVADALLEARKAIADGAAKDAIRTAIAAGAAEDAIRTAMAAAAAEDAIGVAVRTSRTGMAALAPSYAARTAIRAAEAAPVEATHQSILDCLLPSRIQYPFPVNIKGLAATIYNKRDWTLMPILAGALEAIGQEEMAVHCRQPIHAKGCHVLDSIMSKKGK